MGKRSNRRHVRYEKDHLGCMWGLITMFDFRHGRTTQRLLSHRRHGDGDAVGMGNSGNKLDVSTSSGEEKATVMDTCKPSMKKLLEEEMSRDQVAKKEANHTELEAKQFGSGEGDEGSKNRKRNKTRKKSSCNRFDIDDAKKLVSEVRCQHKSEQEQQTTSNFYVDNIVEERELDQKRTNCMNHDQPAEGRMQPNTKSFGFEERLSEAIKFLVSQKLINRNQLTEGGELQASKEVMDALQILSLDEELFLKLLRDPNSLLVKYVKDLPVAQDEESKPLVGSNFSEQEHVGLRQSNELVNWKQRNFFRRMSMFQDIGVSDGNKVSEASSRIVVLKPGPTSSKTPDYESNDFSRHSNIYIEARKHLSEMLTNEEDNVDLSSSQVPKTLERILSLSDYNSSPVGSPERNMEPSFISAQTQFYGSDKFQKVNKNIHLKNVGHLSQSAEETGVVTIAKETEIMVQEDTKLLDASFETSDSSIARDDEIVDVSEVCDEKQYLQCSKQDLSEEDQQSFPPPASPSDTLVNKKLEDLGERLSPVSVPEPIFAEDAISPASIRSISGRHRRKTFCLFHISTFALTAFCNVSSNANLFTNLSCETSIQPLRLQFEDLATNRSSRFKTCMNDKESIFEYIKAMLKASSFDWGELYIRSLSSDLLLDHLFLDEVEYFPNQPCHDKRQLFDCVNEVLTEVCGYCFGSPGVSFVKTNIRPIPNMKNTIEEVCQGVYWHVLPMPLTRSLDQIVRKDMAKTGTWMDLRLDVDFISVEIGEAILEDLLEDTITYDARVLHLYAVSRIGYGYDTGTGRVRFGYVSITNRE